MSGWCGYKGHRPVNPGGTWPTMSKPRKCSFRGRAWAGALMLAVASTGTGDSRSAHSQPSAGWVARFVRYFTLNEPACRPLSTARVNWAFMGELMPTGDQIRRPPAHAGGLPPWERLAIALVLLVVAALVIVIMMSAEPAQHSAPPNVPARAGTTPGVEPPLDSGGR